MGKTLQFMVERLDSRVDVLTQVLNAVRFGSALSARTELGAPWGLHFGSRAGFHVVVAGSCLATVDSTGESVALSAGDVVVFPHGSEHTLSDPPGSPAPEFDDVVAGIAPAERIGPPPAKAGPRSILICGAYSFGTTGMNPLLRGLPELLHIPASPTHRGPLEGAISLLAAEAAGSDSGSGLVIDRLVYVMFVYALRTWLSQQQSASAGSWFASIHDPAIAPAIRAIHDDPSRDWTVTSLAEHSGLSRAPFARRFREAVGEPPVTYLTRWRMTVATELLEQGECIASVARQVGYDNEFAFAKAFKRVCGRPPGEIRRSASDRAAARTEPSAERS